MHRCSPAGRRAWAAAGLGIVAVFSVAGCAPGLGVTRPGTGSLSTGTPQPLPTQLTGIHEIQHIVIIMQENRSFDNYFGTFPGADGIPMHNGVPTVCVPDPQNGQCVMPFHDSQDKDFGGPHGSADATADVDGGKMDGFIQLLFLGSDCDWSVTVDDPAILSRVVNIMTVRGSQGLFEAHESRTTMLRAQGDPACLQAKPACAAPSWSFTLHIVVA
jgi:hypothetical protein